MESSAGTYSSEGWARRGLPRGIPSGAGVRGPRWSPGCLAGRPGRRPQRLWCMLALLPPAVLFCFVACKGQRGKELHMCISIRLHPHFFFCTSMLFWGFLLYVGKLNVLQPTFLALACITKLLKMAIKKQRGTPSMF